MLLQWLRFSIRLLGWVSPSLASRWVYRLWFRPFRFSEPQSERDGRRSATPVSISHRGLTLAADSWGDGPTVLLVHGWHGRGAQLAAVVPALTAAGYRVVSFDAPAHGRSPGEATNLPEISEAIRNVAARCGPVHAIVAHSFGVACSLYAIEQGLNVGRFVAISPPGDVRWMTESFFQTLAVVPNVQRKFVERFETDFGKDLWDRFSLYRLVSNLNVPALVVHDTDDRDVPIAQGRKLASIWPGARFVETHGLGHRRILRDPAVLARISEFLQA